MRAEHVGPIGNTPDVFAESLEAGFCCIIDNKAYKSYGHTDQPLAFYAYIAGSFGNNINSQLAEITKDTGINGSAMPVDIFINLAQDYAEKKYDHQFLKELFSKNREIQLSDLQPSA